MEGNVLELPPKGKPYRDYLDRDYEKEKEPKCAVAHYTMTALNKEVGDMQMTTFTATFGMLMIRHFREEDQIIQISNLMNEVLTTNMVNSHTNEQPFSEIVVEMFQEAKTKAVEHAMVSYLANIDKFKDQAPADDKTAAQHHIDKFVTNMIKNFKGDVASNLEKLSHHDKEGAKNAQRLSALEWCKPVLTFVRDAVKAAVYTASNIITKGEMEDYCTFAVANDKTLAAERVTTKANVTNLQSQVSAVTSAVAESAQTEQDKKLRLRNLSKAVPTPLSQGGTAEQKRANKAKREGELRSWLNKLFQDASFKCNYNVFIIDPKAGSKQTASAILTASLESDKFKIEQLIAASRKVDSSNPSSQRFTGNDHPCLNIPKFQDLASHILNYYVRELESQVAKIQDAERKKLIDLKWRLDIDKTSLFIDRKTSKNPFTIFFEFRDPTNNLTLMRYIPENNPFERFDFQQDIPNPGTRQKALSDAVYAKRYAAYRK